MKNFIEYKDSKIYFQKSKVNWAINPHNCPICGKLVGAEEAVLCINNYKYIPNVVIHSYCFEHFVENDAEYKFSSIEKEYEEYKRLDRIFGNRLRNE